MTQDELKAKLKLINDRIALMIRGGLTIQQESEHWLLVKEANEIQLQIDDMPIPIRLPRKYNP